MSYRELKSYQQSAIIYDFTVEFAEIHVDKAYKSNRSYKSYSRMADQMIQAARSGKQNIVEGSSERTSEKNELHLLGVARASFQELIEDYEDFLRQRGPRLWLKDSPEASALRALAYKSYSTYQSYLSDTETAANTATCLIHQVNFLLDRQIAAAEKDFIQKGDYAEKLSYLRNEERKRQLVNSFWRRHQ
ncbi:four helix bundle protein [Candidatus Wolfebacteria bacterium]|nr:four helix bundle protein [Candidatus Wolfebacteria bacterium]